MITTWGTTRYNTLLEIPSLFALSWSDTRLRLTTHRPIPRLILSFRRTKEGVSTLPWSSGSDTYTPLDLKDESTVSGPSLRQRIEGEGNTSQEKSQSSRTEQELLLSTAFGYVPWHSSQEYLYSSFFFPGSRSRGVRTIDSGAPTRG